MNEDQLRLLGHDGVDKIDNFLEYEHMPLPPQMKLNALFGCLRELRKNLHDLYVEFAGDDPWDDEE